MARQMLGGFEHAGRHRIEAIARALFFQGQQHGPTEWTAGDAVDDEFVHGYLLHLGEFLRTSRAHRTRGFFCEQFKQGWPAAVNAAAHFFSCGGAHAFKVSMLEVDSRAPGAVRDESHFDFGSELHAGLGFPLGADLPAHDEALSRLPDAHVTDDHLRAILAWRVPAPAHERLDDGFLDRRIPDAVRFRPPTIDSVGEHRKGFFWSCLHEHAFTHGRNADCGTQGFFLRLIVLGFSTSLLKASSAFSQNWSSQRRSSPNPLGSR